MCNQEKGNNKMKETIFDTVNKLLLLNLFDRGDKMITKHMALTITHQGKNATILKAITEIDHQIIESAQKGYDGLCMDLHTRKLDKTERKTIKLYYETLGYVKVRVGKRSCNIEWGE